MGAATVKCVAAAALTVMMLLVPVMLVVTVSVVGNGPASRLQGGAEGACADAQRAVGGQRSGGVGAGEADRATVGGGRVVERILPPSP